LALIGAASISFAAIPAVQALYRPEEPEASARILTAGDVSLPVWAEDVSQTGPGSSDEQLLTMFCRGRNAAADDTAAGFTDLSDWAEPSVLWLDQLGLIPEKVKTAPMTAPISRFDLCVVARSGCTLLSGLTGTELMNTEVSAVIDGLCGGFAPNAPLTRQELYCFLSDLLGAMGCEWTGDIIRDLSGIEDRAELSAYARQPVQALIAAELIPGQGRLHPESIVPAQDALDLLSRTISFYAAWSEHPTVPRQYLGQEAAQFALQFEGCRYVYGSRGPTRFDCSGLVYYVYKQFGYDLKPGAQTQWSNLDRSVSREDLMPGDLVFFSRNGRASGIFHVGIYIGGGEFIHAANHRKGVIITGLDEAWYAHRYLGAKRPA
jgi:hypothetical protein